MTLVVPLSIEKLQEGQLTISVSCTIIAISESLLPSMLLSFILAVEKEINADLNEKSKETDPQTRNTKGDKLRNKKGY